MSKRLKLLCVGLVIILAVVSAVAIVYMDRRNGGVNDIYDVRLMAEELYAQGDLENAIYQMDVYCTYVFADVEARTLLGDWYKEAGDEEKAYECYYNAALNKALSEETMPSLSVKNTAEIILEPINKVAMEITPDVRETKDMYLTITGQNLVPAQVDMGRISGKEAELVDQESFFTTDWFKVDSEGEYLTMSGGFNCAIWQFKNANGEITHVAESANEYRVKGSYAVDVYQMARAVIPEKSAWCRVTYYDKNREEDTVEADEELTIVYGRLPGESKRADYKRYTIPDLKDGESIIYADGAWSLKKDGVITILEDWQAPSIERGSHIVIGGTLPGRVSFEKSMLADFGKGKIYSIKFDLNNPSAMGERCDDAINLGFNAAVAQGTIALGENHFDSIYPWKDMRLCNIKDGEVVFYEGEEGFSENGEAGDVFVEIPKFYVRRVLDENYETISISDICHFGFELDEAFVKENGEEAEKIYVAAYLTAMDENVQGVSMAETSPVICSAKDARELALRKGYEELDYHALSALQKLFMVETGLRNSQYLYLGACGYTMASENDGTPNYAVAREDREKTNCIVVDKRYNFKQGNSIIVFDANKYELTGETVYHDVRRVNTVIDNNDGTQSVYISGEQTDVISGRTAIAHVALENGTTRRVAGHTGAESTERGTVALKYRNIENFWGNVFVYIDGVTINGQNVTVKKRTGETVALSYTLPERVSHDLRDNMVRAVGYDSNHPQIMLPSIVGNGATISTYYGDAFIGSDENDETVLHYGGGWSSQACAGLFNFVASASFDETHTNTSGRMMLVK